MEEKKRKIHKIFSGVELRTLVFVWQQQKGIVSCAVSGMGKKGKKNIHSGRRPEEGVVDVHESGL